MVSLDLTNKLSSKDRAALKRVEKNISQEAENFLNKLLDIAPKNLPRKERQFVKLVFGEGYTRVAAYKLLWGEESKAKENSMSVIASRRFGRVLNRITAYCINHGLGDRLESLRHSQAEARFQEFMVFGSDKHVLSLTKGQLFGANGKPAEKPMAMVNIGQVFITHGKVEHPPLEGQVINVPVEEIEKRNDMGESEK